MPKKFNENAKKTAPKMVVLIRKLYFSCRDRRSRRSIKVYLNRRKQRITPTDF